MRGVNNPYIPEMGMYLWSLTMNESDRWFHIQQDLIRERAARLRRSNKRVLKAIKRNRAEARCDPNVKMELSEWTLDEYGNLCRTIQGVDK